MVTFPIGYSALRGASWQRFLGGRTRYHRQRQMAAYRRQCAIVKEMASGRYDYLAPVDKRAMQSLLAARFGVTDRTIRDDLKAIREGSATCPLCGQPKPQKSP